MKNLVIVESPAKAKTIEKYLGSDFAVLSSVGHIRSIAKRKKGGADTIDVENNFETTYEIDPEKRQIISNLKKAVKESDTVWLATDEDREGEAIAWHLVEVLKLDPKTTKRIVFHEITERAIKEAVKNPRIVDMDLVRAQQARQILDRLVGFKLSPVVWQKVPGGKSAGRVQSPAVRLLVERERERQEHQSKANFKITTTFQKNAETVTAELPEKPEAESEAEKILQLLGAANFKVSEVTKTPGTRNPGQPFTTSTLQQEANSRLGMSAKATMSAAQKLYQEGKITYMRTDSVSLSPEAMKQIGDYITKSFGSEYYQARAFKTKSASAQEAHEAIRPTDISREKVSENSYDQKLYDLIRKRTIASQMKPALLEKTIARITASTIDQHLVAKGEVITFEGYMKIYGKPKSNTAVLPALAQGDTLVLITAQAKQQFSRPPARYTEGSLVKKLEELGIGRPSTYATIINTVLTRGYAEKGESEGDARDNILLTLENGAVTRSIEQEKTDADRGKLVPTARGFLLADFLTAHFNSIVDYSFTAQVEQEFDLIALGKLGRNDMLHEFYEPFSKLVEASGSIKRSDVAQAKILGTDPKTSKTISARFGRFGPMLQLGDSENDEEKPQFAPLPKGSTIETVTLEQAVTMFQLPRLVGKTDGGDDIKANIGRFGPYVQVGKMFVSIKDLDPFTIDEETAKKLVQEKVELLEKSLVHDFGTIQVKIGRWGPYVTDGSKNVKLPKNAKPEDITKQEALKYLSTAPKSKKRPPKRKKLK